jgi:hypothetical protein
VSVRRERIVRGGVIDSENPYKVISLDTVPCKMSFFQKLVNTVAHVAQLGVNHLYMLPQQDKLVKKYFPNGPSVYDVTYNASILLLNSHPSTNQPVPHVPSMIDVGGTSCETS